VNDPSPRPIIFVTSGTPNAAVAEKCVVPERVLEWQQCQEPEVRPHRPGFHCRNPPLRSLSHAVDCIRSCTKTVRIGRGLLARGMYERARSKRRKFAAHQVSNRDRMGISKPGDVAGKAFDTWCTDAYRFKRIQPAPRRQQRPRAVPRFKQCRRSHKLLSEFRLDLGQAGVVQVSSDVAAAEMAPSAERS